MGVKNLWRLLLPCGKRVSIETLSHQTLAIDASIWLTQISKACRDPETGRLLPNRPHVRIFLLRLMRLLYHQIKPVVVFDGIMPEIKRRELQRRRDRREKLWKGTGENGEDADLALKRTAKKILVKQLKDWRERKLESSSKVNDNDDDENNERSPSKMRSSATKTAGAFAAGFTTGREEDEADAIIQSTPLSDNAADNNDDNDVITDSKGGSSNDDAISIKSSSEGEEDQQSKPRGRANLIHDGNDNEEYESENDWELSIAIQSSISDSVIQQQKQIQQQIQYQELSHQPVEAIASLPTETRSRWMESQYKAQRIQSRKECIGAAANPEDYSSTQLRNFLKGSRLNKKMCQIGKLAGQLGVDNENNNGFVTVEENHNVGGGGGHHRRVLKRPGNKDSDDSDDDILNDELATATKKVSMKVLFGEDDDESEGENGIEEEGGGFLLPNNGDEVMNAVTTASKEIVIDDSSAEEDSSTQETNDVFAMSHDDTLDRSKTNGDAMNTSSSTAARTRLLALSSADQEWASWGETNKNVEPFTSSFTMRTMSNGDAPTSESDSDGEPTFLPMKSSPVNAAARPVGPTSQKRYLLDDEADDDVDWEDGGEVDQGNDQEENSSSFNNFASHLQCQEDDNGDQDEDIDWEDGGEELESKNGACQHQNHTTRQLFHSSAQSHGNDDVEILSDEDHLLEQIEGDCESLNKDGAEVEKTSRDTKSRLDSVHMEEEIFDVDEAQETSLQSDSSHNSFEMEDVNSDDPTTAALRHAQETASRLTDWAGRAVQRAIAAHIEEKGGSPLKKTMAEKKSQMVDLTVGGHETEDDGNVEETHANKQAATQNAKDSSSTPHKKLDLFDTSLEGLNKVHRDIIEEEKLMERDMSTITDDMKMDILNLLQLCGIPWVESPSEAEAQCAALEELGLVDGIVTEDSDVFVFGGRKVYKNFFNEQKYVEAYFARDIEKDLALGRSQLVALAMLLGGDYTDGVKGVGIVNGMEILQSFAIDDGREGIRDGLQRFREWLDGLDDPLADEDEPATFLSKLKLFHKKHQSARTRWIAPADFPSPAIIDGYMKPAVDSSAASFTWGKPDIDGLRLYCANSIGWDDEETDRIVQPVLKIIESGSKQTRIESYFMKYDDNIKFAEVRSKRLKAVLDDIQTKGYIKTSKKRRRIS